MKKLVALMLALALCMSMVVISASADETFKIVMMVDTTVVDQNNGRDAFEARWEELHPGFDLEIIQPDHSAYYDVMQQRMSSGDWPDASAASSATPSSKA